MFHARSWFANVGGSGALPCGKNVSHDCSIKSLFAIFHLLKALATSGLLSRQAYAQGSDVREHKVYMEQ